MRQQLVKVNFKILKNTAVRRAITPKQRKSSNMYYYFDKVISSLIGIFIFWRFLKWKKKEESVPVAEEFLTRTITMHELVICIVYYSKLKFSLSVQLSLTSYYYYKIFALVGLSELYITFTLLPTFGTEFPALIHFLFLYFFPFTMYSTLMI